MHKGPGLWVEIRTELGLHVAWWPLLTIPALAASNATNGLLYGRLALRDIALLPNGNTVQALVRLEANPVMASAIASVKWTAPVMKLGQILDTRLGDSGLDYWLSNSRLP